MNTALGNCIIMCGLVYAYSNYVGVPIKLVNNGDDCVAFMERKHQKLFSSQIPTWFLDMGFRMTVEPPVYILEQVEFCQMRPIATATGYTMVRNFNTAREKDSICLNPISGPTSMQKWLFAIGECGLALCAGIPVMQSLYQCYMRNGLPSNVNNSVQMQSGMAMLRRKLESVAKPITDASRVSFMQAWNVTPDEQIALERYYDGLILEYRDDTTAHLADIHSSPL